jgi:multiple sugar transport system permease protein/sn-glycerol 3-phosphate transport system permease protein
MAQGVKNDAKTTRARRPWGRWARQGANWLALGIITFVMLVPIIWMIAYSFAPPQGMGSGESLFPSSFRVDGFIQVFEQTPFFRWLANSVFVSTVQTAAQLAIAFLAAFALAHFSFKGRTAIFYFALATMVIPSQTMMIPTFIAINSLGWINTYAGVIVPSLASGYAIFLLRQFFIGIPRALIDSARVDGCGERRILLHIYLPLSVPVIMALASILFVNHWNEYYWPLLVLSDKEMMTLPLALVHFRNEGIIEWVPTLAAASLATAPVLILFFFTQKNFVEGFSTSGIKG